MCNPALIAGAVLMAGSAVANNAAASRVNRARNNALEEETLRQRKLQGESQALAEDSQTPYRDFQGQMEKDADELAAYFRGQRASEIAPPVSLPESGSNVTVAEEAKQRGRSRAYTDAQGVALGALRAFGETMGDASRLTARNAGQIGTLGGFMQNSRGVLPFELDAASRKGDNLNMLGSVMGGIGSMLVAGGLAPTAAAAGAGAASGVAGAAGGAGVSTPAVVGFTGTGAQGLRSSLGDLYALRMGF